MQRQNGELDLSIELLNPGDRVYLELISVNNTSDLTYIPQVAFGF